MLYHIGTCKDKNTLIIQARKDIDYLSCELYDYFGQRETTKKSLKVKAKEFLVYLQETKPNVYGKLTKVKVD